MVVSLSASVHSSLVTRVYRCGSTGTLELGFPVGYLSCFRQYGGLQYHLSHRRYNMYSPSYADTSFYTRSLVIISRKSRSDWSSSSILFIRSSALCVASSFISWIRSVSSSRDCSTVVI